MNDRKTPDEEQELFDELDDMYQRAADTDDKTVVLENKKPKRNKKRPSRSFMIITSIVFILLASVLAVTLLKPTFITGLFKSPDTQSPTAAVTPVSPESPVAVVTAPDPPATPETADAETSSATGSVAPSVESALPPAQSPPVQAKPEAAETAKLLPPAKYYTIQVGAFGNMNNVRRITEAFEKEGVKAYRIKIKSSSGETLYRVLVGQFMNKNEAVRFLKDKKILKHYPDSFIKVVTSSKMNL